MRPRLALLTLLAAVSLVAAGCGGTGPERTLLSLASSAERTSGTGTYRTEMRISMTMPGVEKPLELTATGSVDTAGRRQALTMDMSQLMGALGGATGATPAASDLRVEMVVDGLTMYMRTPLLSGQLPKGKQWVSVDVARMAAASGADLSSLLGRSYADPSQFLDYLRTAGDPVELGSEEVRGVEARHVRTTLDLKAYLAAAAPKLREQLRPVVDQFEQMAGSVSPVVDAWIDDEGLVRRIALDLGVAAPGAATAGVALEMTMAIDLFDFGADVAIEVPPAAEVADGTSLGLGG